MAYRQKQGFFPFGSTATFSTDRRSSHPRCLLNSGASMSMLASCKGTILLAWSECSRSVPVVAWSECSRSVPVVASFTLRGTVVSNHKNACCICLLHVYPSMRHISRQMRWTVNSTVDGSGWDRSSSSNSNNTTRLFRAIQSFWNKLTRKLKELRRGLAVKILFFLVGFYCATAFATVIGQTGDWDILSAGLAVAVVEGIGALMYRAPFTFIGRIRNLITIFNFWKAGLSLGLFLDSFKYEVDTFLESCNLFKFEINISTMFW